MKPEYIYFNGRITTLDPRKPEVSALAVFDGKISATGNNEEIKALADHSTKMIDLRSRRVVPGLNDSHPSSVLDSTPTSNFAGMESPHSPRRSKCSNIRRKELQPRSGSE